MIAFIKELLFATLRRQLVAGMVIVTAVMMSTFVWNLTVQQKAVLLEQQTSQATSLAQSIATVSTDWLAARDYSGLQEIVEAQKRYQDMTYAIILDKHGHILAHSDIKLRGKYLHDLPGIPKLYILHQTPELVDVAYPVILSGEYTGWVRVGIAQHSTAAKLDEITRNGIFFVLTAIAISAILASLLARYLTRRLYAIQAVADAVQYGNSDLRAHVTGLDEAAQLATRFNEMLDKLAQRENELIKSRDASRLQSRAIEESPVMVLITDIDCKIEYVNPAFTNITGYQSAEIIGQNIRHMQVGLSSDNIYDDIRNRLERGESWGGSLLNRKKDGSQFWVSANMSPVRNDAGAIINYVAVEEDISERKKLEEAVRQNRDHLLDLVAEQTASIKAIVDTAADGIITIDQHGTVLSFNPAAENMFGYKKEEAIGRNITLIMPASYQTTHNEYIQHYVDTNKTHVIGAGRELMGQRKDGSQFPLHVTVSEMLIGDERRFTGILRDITQQKAAENLLREAERMLREMSDNLPAVVFEYASDATGDKFNFVGRHVENMFGVNRDAVLQDSQLLLNLIANEDLEHFASVRKFSKEQNMPWECEFRIHHPDGTLHWLKGSAVPVRNIQDESTSKNVTTIWSGYLIDISEQKSMQTQLAHAKEIAESASRAKSNFLANMSHEIRTPMNAIIGMTDLVLDSPLQPDQAKLLQGVASSSKSLLVILNDILDLSKLESGKMDLEKIPFSIRQLLEGVEEMIKIGAATKGLTLDVYVDDAVPKCLIGDPTRLRQVLLNLVGNAIKFTGHGGITISVHASTQPDEWHLSIRDTGIGIASDRLNQVFERFSQADETTTRRFGGTGLGTTISREIVEQMGGRIWVESEEGQGSDFQFTVHMPEAIGVENCTMQSYGKAIGVAPRTRPLKILLAEDIPLNQELVIRRLSQRHHDVVVANNGKIAVDLFRRYKFDLILMDVMMPEMDGEAATRMIREIEATRGFPQEHIPIIMLTASVMQADQRKFFESGADDFAGKPIDFTDLYTKIAQFFPVLEGSTEEHGHPEPKLPNLDGLDLKAGLSTWGDFAAYRKALTAFRLNYAEAITKLQGMLDKARYEDAKLLAHTVKGLAGNLGALELARAITGVENCAKNGHSDCATQLTHARSVMDITLTAIDQLERQPHESPATEIRSIEPALALPALNKLITALERSELDEAAINTLRQELDTERFARLEGLIDGFEFDMASTLAQEIRTTLEMKRDHHE